MNVTVIFDGQCGMCTRTVKALKRMDRHDRLMLRPCQSVPEEGWEGIRPAQCEAAVWTVAEDGAKAQGSDAAMMIAAALMNGRWPMTFGKLPVVQQVMQVVYRAVARNRRRFPGEKPWCQQHPEDCEPTNHWSTS